MADNPKITDDLDEENKQTKKNIFKNRKRIIFGASALVLMIVLAIIIAILLVGNSENEIPDQTQIDSLNDEAQNSNEMNMESTENIESKIKLAGSKAKAIFYTIRPPFVVNFQDSTRAKYLQVSIDVMARSDAAIAAVENHLPIIKNDLINLLSSQTYEVLRTAEGREALRKSATMTIQSVLSRETGSTGIEDVLFTTFVMQ